MIKKEVKQLKKTLAKAEAPRPKKYFEGLGRRKTAVARVRVNPGSGQQSANNADFKRYFKVFRNYQSATAPLTALNLDKKFDISAKIEGGGLMAQAGAVCLGLARALIKYDQEYKKRLRKYGYLTRDSRMVERKKYGLKKARRAPQWQKR